MTGFDGKILVLGLGAVSRCTLPLLLAHVDPRPSIYTVIDFAAPEEHARWVREAGITLVTALASLLTGRPVRPRVAMTGEMTLSGRVLPVGGIKEKVLAAHRLGIKEVILPKRNEKAVKEDIPENVRTDLKLHLVSSIEEVLELALSAGDPYEVARDKGRWQLRLN